MLIVHLSVSYAHVNPCHCFSSHGIRGWLRLLLVALPVRFCLPFYTAVSVTHFICDISETCLMEAVAWGRGS